MSSISTSTGEGSSKSSRRPDSMRCQARGGAAGLAERADGRARVKVAIRFGSAPPSKAGRPAQADRSGGRIRDRPRRACAEPSCQTARRGAPWREVMRVSQKNPRAVETPAAPPDEGEKR
ncbi:MAG: hypothetical protein Kow00133_09550 [Amphiplicatus sp.]